MTKHSFSDKLLAGYFTRPPRTEQRLLRIVEWLSMTLNKKQKKQIDVIRKKLTELRQRLAGAKQQPDDPAEVPRLEREIVELEDRVHKIQAEV